MDDRSAGAAPARPDPDDETLLEFDPQWCLFWAEGVAAFQFEVWLPYLRRSRFRYVVMAGEDRVPESVRETIATLPNVRVLEPYAGARGWLRLCPGFRGFLYVGNKTENYRVVNTFADASHVWLGHGESDKVYNAFRTASLYDSVFVARDEAVKRYPPAIRRWVASGACAIGTPVSEGAIRDPWDGPRTIRTILYAPTWEGHSERAHYSSLAEVGPLLIDAMPRLSEHGVHVILRPHPSTGTRLPDLRAMRDAVLAAGAVRGRDKAADFAAADVMISDISGVTAEFLFTEKPALMPLTRQLAAVGKDEAQLDAEYPWVDRWDVGAEDLVERLDRLAASDPLRSERARAARAMFRGHRTLEEAVVSFDLALESVGRRASRIPVRWVYEAKRRLPRLRERP